MIRTGVLPGVLDIIQPASRYLGPLWNGMNFRFWPGLMRATKIQFDLTPPFQTAKARAKGATPKRIAWHEQL